LHDANRAIDLTAKSRRFSPASLNPLTNGVEIEGSQPHQLALSLLCRPCIFCCCQRSQAFGLRFFSGLSRLFCALSFGGFSLLFSDARLFFLTTLLF